MSDATIEVPRGLAGVVVTETELSGVRGQEGFYHYREYSAVELAEQRSLEDVWFLLLHGRLPTAPESRAHREQVGAARQVPHELLDLLPSLAPAGAAPLTTLRTAWSWLGAHWDLAPLYDCTEQERLATALRCAAVAPAVLAAALRHSRGEVALPPDPARGHAEDYLRMVSGDEPEARDIRAIEQYLVLTLDHGFSASTFAARTIASTGADMVAALVGAVGAFSGPLHGGAPSRALEALDQIGSADRARPWVREQVAAGRRVMGFGHPVYRTHDPRSELLKAIARDRGGDLADLAVQVEQEVEAALAELKPDRPLYANVEFYAGVVMEQAGVPRSMFTPTFCVARAVGWVANVLEQARDPKIIRPTARYVGPPAPRPVPVR